MATTTPDNLWSPDGGDQYALTVDLAAMQDTTQSALTALRSGLVMQRGTNAQRLALSGGQLFEGLHYWTTDTRLEWIYTNSAWVSLGGADTGWVDVTVSSGFGTPSPNERPQVRRIGNIVLMKGGWSNSGMGANGTFSVGAIPSGFIPPVNVINGIGSSSGDAVAVGFITSGGGVQVRTSSTLGAYYFFGGISWTVN